MKKFIHIISVFIILTLISGAITGCYVLKRFGKMPGKDDIAKYSGLSYFKDGKFISPEEQNYYPDRVTGGSMGFGRFFKKSKYAPKKPFAKVMLSKDAFPETPENYAIYWLGHSSLLMDIDGSRFLFDPVFGNAAPVPIAAKRYDLPPLAHKDLPHIDFVVLTHNHYDHLEYKTIKKLKKTDTKFIVPLGIKALLKGWGIKEENIHELGWGDSYNANGIEITAEKALHYSNRQSSDRFKTLWVSFIIKGKNKKIFVSGDTGYGKIFKEIGKVYGPFDLAFIEIDGWNNGWPNIHLFPEEVIKVMKDINAKNLIPTHWAVFDLALHPWDESIKMITELAKDNNINVISPLMGQKIVPGITETSYWWEGELIGE